MLLSVAWLVAGLLLLIVGAEGLVRGSTSLALRTGLTPLVVGLTVVAFGTSTPELVVSLNASLAGSGDIAIGNVIGSNIANVGLILGVAAIICPIPVSLSVLKVDAPVMVVATGCVLLLIASGPIGALAGAFLVLTLVAYTGMNVWLARKQTARAAEVDFGESMEAPSGSLVRDLVFLATGLLLLVFGARLLVHGATDLARSIGISEAVIGLSVVAFGTSLPELAASVVAALRKQPDIAVGNIIGSNLFNLLGILGVGAMVRPLEAPGINNLDLWVCMALSVALIPLIWTGRRLLRWEGGLLLAAYIAYVVVRAQMG